MSDEKKPDEAPVVTEDEFLSDDADQPEQVVPASEMKVARVEAAAGMANAEEGDESAPKPKIEKAPGYRLRVRRGHGWGLIKQANKVRFFKKDELRSFVEARGLDRDYYKIVCPNGEIVDVRPRERFPRKLP